MMYGSVSGAAKELNYPFPEMAFGRRKEETEHQRTQQLSSGLLRYRSAPGSLLGEICEDFHPLRPSSPETEAIFSHLISPELHGEKPAGSDGRKNPHLPSSSAAAVDHREALLPSQMLYNSKVQLMTKSAGGDSNLIRQSSSPSGLFCCLKGDSGYGFKSQISFSSRQDALSLITDVESDEFSGGRHSERQEKCGGSVRLYVPGYPISSSEESSLISGNLLETGSASRLKRGRSMDGEAGKNQTDYHKNEEKMRPRISGIVHQLGLPKPSSEIAVLEKLLQFQDAVPCKIRAKRGCATHPRSIAERVRRTRISERMKKLQELVPNMDKQTNTSDMLDLAIEYIKDLQRQIRSLKESGESCSCLSSKQRSCQNFES